MSHPVPLLAMAIPSALYAAGTARLWWRAGAGRGLRKSEAACGLAGFAVLAASLLSPLHHYSEQVFAAHMIEHELLMTIAAPLIVLGNPLAGMLWAFPPGGRRRLGSLAGIAVVGAVWRWFNGPLIATILHGLAIWIWHVPDLFVLALASQPVHWLQHASFLLSALLFWSSLWRASSPGVALLCIFATAIHTGLLGALLTFSETLWYAPRAPEVWGLTPLEDQQLAGLIMWVPVNIAYLAAALAAAARLIGEPREAAR